MPSSGAELQARNQDDAPRSLEDVELLVRALEDDALLAAREPANLRWFDARTFDEAELEARAFDEMEWLEARNNDNPPPYHPFDPVNGPTPPYSRHDPNPPPKYHKKDPNRKKSWQFWKKGKRSVGEVAALEARNRDDPPPYTPHDPHNGPKPKYSVKDPNPPPKYHKKDPKDKKPWQVWKGRRSVDEFEELEARNRDDPPPYSPHDPHNGPKPKYSVKDPNPPPKYHKKDPKDKKPWQVWKGRRSVDEFEELEARNRDDPPPYSPHDPHNGPKPKYSVKDPNPPPKYHKKDPKDKKPWQVWKGRRAVDEGMEDWE